MIEVVRIIDEDKLYSYRATKNPERAKQLDTLINSTKEIKNLHPEWDEKIGISFSNMPPYDEARFRTKFAKRNIFYSSLKLKTALYEIAFLIMQERNHLKSNKSYGERTAFWVDAKDTNVVKIHEHPDCEKIMHKSNYTFSHRYIEDNPEVTFILYPSSRDPNRGDNAAILDINHLSKTLNSEKNMNFFYEGKKKQLTWIDYNFPVTWEQVS